jgi:hypothetical protein
MHSSPSSLEIRRQVEQRIINVMQKNSGKIIEFNVENSIDEDISISTERKENNKQLFDRVIKRYSIKGGFTNGKLNNTRSKKQTGIA